MQDIRFNDILGVEQTVDLSQEKFNVAFNADCMDLLRALPDKSVVLACVDPPYGDASSQSVNVERERERAIYNRFGNPGSRFERYKTNGIVSDSDSTDTKVTRTGGTWAEKYGKKS